MKQNFLNFFRSPDDGGSANKTWDDLIAAVTANETAAGSAEALMDADTGVIATLKQQIADLLSGTTVPPAVQTKINDLFAKAQANADALAASVTKNTPQE